MVPRDARGCLGLQDRRAPLSTVFEAFQAPSALLDDLGRWGSRDCRVTADLEATGVFLVRLA